MTGMYVCVCMTQGIRHVYDVMYVCVGKHTSLENDRYVCLLWVCMYETYVAQSSTCEGARFARPAAEALRPPPHPLPRYMSDTPHRCCMFVTKQIHRGITRVYDAWLLDVCMTSCMYVWGHIHR